jgi:hypothetical protein
MQANTRFIQSVVSSSKSTEVTMPWTSGKRRNEFVSSDKAHDDALRAKAA